MDVVPRQRQQMADSSLEYNMSTQVRCPYDPVHVIVRRKMPAHLAKCSKNFPDNPLMTCPFNITHQCPRSMMVKHVEECTDARNTASAPEQPINVTHDVNFAIPAMDAADDLFAGLDDDTTASPTIVPPPASLTGSSFSGTPIKVDAVGAPWQEEEPVRHVVAVEPAPQPVGRGRGRSRGQPGPYINKPQRRLGAAVGATAVGSSSTPPVPVPVEMAKPAAVRSPPGFSQPYATPPASSLPKPAPLQTASNLPDFLRDKINPQQQQYPTQQQQQQQQQYPTQQQQQQQQYPTQQQQQQQQQYPTQQQQRALGSGISEGNTSYSAAEVTQPSAIGGPAPETENPLEQLRIEREQKKKELDRTQRRYEKLLNQIKSLELRCSEGKQLDADQLSKIDRKSEAQKELEKVRKEKQALLA